MLGSGPEVLPDIAPLLEMRYRNRNIWYPLPRWGHFYVALGALLARESDSSRRTVVGLAVPTRAFAATLAALGVVVAAHAGVDATSPEDHFRLLAELPAGTPVSVLSDSRKTRGILCGCIVLNDQPMLKVQLSTKGDISYFPTTASLRVQPAPTDAVALGNRPVTRARSERTGFVNLVLGDTDVQRFLNSSRPDCLLVGSRNLLGQEILETRFALERTAGRTMSGTLQDVLRVRQFSRRHESYRSIILPASGGTPQLPAGISRPLVTIVDGASGYLKWRHLWRGSQLIVLLDRIDPLFSLAVQQLNQDESRPGIATPDLIGLPDVPAGTEIIVYREPRR